MYRVWPIRAPAAASYRGSTYLIFFAIEAELFVCFFASGAVNTTLTYHHFKKFLWWKCWQTVPLLFRADTLAFIWSHICGQLKNWNLLFTFQLFPTNSCLFSCWMLHQIAANCVCVLADRAEALPAARRSFAVKNMLEMQLHEQNFPFIF